MVTSRRLFHSLGVFTPRLEFPEYNMPLGAFASHHRRALADLRELAPQIDFVLEFRDSRAPLSSINPLISQALPGVPRLTLYSKWDLSRCKSTLLKPLHPEGDYRLVSTDERKYASRLLKELQETFSKENLQPPLGFKVLVAGMPNAGKSAFINMFRTVTFGRRTKKVAATAPSPGVTRAVSEQIMISAYPKIYVVDSPGVLLPKVQNGEHMLKLALIGAVPLQTVDPIVAADYLLFKQNLHYPNGGRYPGPVSNNINQVLWNLAQTNRQRPSRDTWDPNQTAITWIKRYISGGIGNILLDDMSVDYVHDYLEMLNDQRYDLNDLLPAGGSKLKFRRF